MKKNKDKPLYIKQSFLPKFDKIRKLLAEKYPNCFVDEGGQPKPLKIGIIDEIYDALNVSDLVCKNIKDDLVVVLELEVVEVEFFGLEEEGVL